MLLSQYMVSGSATILVIFTTSEGLTIPIPVGGGLRLSQEVITKKRAKTRKITIGNKLFNFLILSPLIFLIIIIIVYIFILD